MTRFFDATFEGASLTGANGASSVTGTVTLDSGAVVKDTYSAKHDTSSSYLRFDITASDEIYVSCYIYLTTVANSIRTIYITNGCRLDIRSNRALRLQTATGTQIGSDSAVLSLNTLYRVGVRWKKATGAGNDGEAEAWVANADDAFGTSFAVGTNLTQTAQLSRVDIGNTSGATTNTFYTDDVRIDNASMPGPSIAFTEVDTTFTASASFQKWEATWTASASFATQVDKTFTASASFNDWATTFTASVSFSGTIDNEFTAAASFAVLVDNEFTAAASFSAQVDNEFTASASFQKWEATWTASASFQGTYDTTFTASASFAVELPHLATFTVAASFSVSGSPTYSPPSFYPYPESFEPNYEVRIASPDGEYIDIIDTYANLDYTLVTNDVGSCSIELPGNYPLNRLVKDTRIEVWRSVGFGPLTLEGNTQFLVQGRERGINDQGLRTLKVMGLSLNHILKRRIVPYNSTQLAYVDMADAADNLMKEIINTNFSTTALDADRVISTDYFRVDDITGRAPTVWKIFPHKNVYDVLKEIADSSYQLGTPLFFEVVVDYPPRKHVFRTWVTARGTDRRFSTTSSNLLLGFDHGSIGAYTVTEDWSNEVGYVYVAGPGEDDVRSVQPAQDNTIIGRSPYGRSELWVDSQDSDTDDKLLSEAAAYLVANRTKKLFVGKLLSTPQATYGVHWGWGDYVTADVDDEQFDCFVSSVHVNLAAPDGKENIDAGLRSD